MLKGYIYLLIVKEFLNKKIIKIGCTKQESDNFIKRFKSYSRGITIVFLRLCPHEKIFLIEKDILKKFNQNFKIYQGNEYFEGDPSIMISIITEIMDEHEFGKKNIITEIMAKPELVKKNITHSSENDKIITELMAKHKFGTTNIPHISENDKIITELMAKHEFGKTNITHISENEKIMTKHEFGETIITHVPIMDEHDFSKKNVIHIPKNEKIIMEDHELRKKNITLIPKNDFVQNINQKISWKMIKNFYESYKQIISKRENANSDLDFLILSLIILHPPRKSNDYTSMYINNNKKIYPLNESMIREYDPELGSIYNKFFAEDRNYVCKKNKKYFFIFTNYALNYKFGMQIIRIIPELEQIINDFINKNNLKNHCKLINLSSEKYNERVKKIFSNFFGRKISLNKLRKLFAQSYEENNIKKYNKYLEYMLG